MYGGDSPTPAIQDTGDFSCPRPETCVAFAVAQAAVHILLYLIWKLLDGCVVWALGSFWCLKCLLHQPMPDDAMTFDIESLLTYVEADGAIWIQVSDEDA